MADTEGMPSYRDEAVVLRTHRLGEADRIVTLLTKAHGKVRAVAKGVRRTSSKFGARLEPFMVVDVQCWQGRNLDTVQQAVSLAQYGADIASDYGRYEAASVMVELADRVTEADSGATQHVLLVGALRALARGEHASQHILDSYTLRSLALAGWAPSLLQCGRCGRPGPSERFVPALGGAACEQCARGGERVEPAVLLQLQRLLEGDWAALSDVGTIESDRASRLVAAYAEFHLETTLRARAVAERGRLASTPARGQR